MPVKGFIWDEEYKEKYYSYPKVQYHLEVFAEMAKKPKSEEVKHKMSIAKLNVPKTDEQKRKMSETQKKRHALFKVIKAQEPTLTKDETWGKVKGLI
jgi:hypothetical protein